MEYNCDFVPCKQKDRKSSFSPLDSSIKLKVSGCPLAKSNGQSGRSIPFVTWAHPHLLMYPGSPTGRYQTFHTLMSAQAAKVLSGFVGAKKGKFSS